MKEELFNKIKESCEFLYHNHPEILQQLHQRGEIVPLSTILIIHGSKVFGNILLKDKLNLIYDLLSIKGAEIPLEIRNNTDKAIELQKELIERISYFIKNADEIFKEQDLETVDEDYFIKTASEFQEMIQASCEVIRDKNEAILRFMIVPGKNNVRSLLDILKKFNITDDIDLNNAVMELYNLMSVKSDKIDIEIMSSATKAKKFQEEIISEVCRITTLVLESSIENEQIAPQNKRSIDQTLLQATDQDQAKEEESESPEKKVRRESLESSSSTVTNSPPQKRNQEFMDLFNCSESDLSKPLSQSPELMDRILQRIKALQPKRSPSPSQGQSGQHQGRQISINPI